MEDQKWETVQPRAWASMTLREQGTLMIGMGTLQEHPTPTIASMIAIADVLALWYGVAREQLYEATMPDIMELVKRAGESVTKLNIGTDAEAWLKGE